MLILLAGLMVLHGAAHLVSFFEAWRLVPGGFPYKTTVLAGRVDLGDGGVRAVGVIWLFVSVAFVVASVGAVAGATWWVPMAVGTTFTSLLLTSTEWPEARVGVAINLLILAVLMAGR
jgi:hypothetical protein